MSTLQETPAGQAGRGTPWRRVGALLAVLIAVVLLAQWWLTPDAFSPYTTSQSVDPERALNRDETLVVPLGAMQDRNDVVVTRAAPRVDANGPAYVEVLACTGNPVIGVGDVERMCVDPRPADGVQPRGAAKRAELMLVIHTLGATRVEVSGVDLTYRAGLQRGRQHVGERYVVHFDLNG